MYVLESKFMYMETKCIHDLFCNFPKQSFSSLTNHQAISLRTEKRKKEEQEHYSNENGENFIQADALPTSFSHYMQ
jgi:uncharacterized membrane protein YkgB